MTKCELRRKFTNTVKWCWEMSYGKILSERTIRKNIFPTEIILTSSLHCINYATNIKITTKTPRLQHYPNAELPSFRHLRQHVSPSYESNLPLLRLASRSRTWIYQGFGFWFTICISDDPQLCCRVYIDNATKEPPKLVAVTCLTPRDWSAITSSWRLHLSPNRSDCCL